MELTIEAGILILAGSNLVAFVWWASRLSTSHENLVTVVREVKTDLAEHTESDHAFQLQIVQKLGGIKTTYRSDNGSHHNN